MREVTQEQVVECLLKVGVKEGDGLLTHSAVQFLGRPTGGVGMYYDAILQVIGSQGTLVVPTFNFAFARGEPYDPDNTPSQGMGAFTEYVRQLPQAQRTSHPLQSLAITGHYADDLAGRDTLSAFDPGSAFERMLELDFQLLLLGADIRASSIFHYSEHRYQVPYRYWKYFTGQVKSPQGSKEHDTRSKGEKSTRIQHDTSWQTRTYRMFVRDLNINPILTAEPVQKLLEERCQWRTAPLNYGKISACRLRDFVAAVDHFLAADPWSLVTNRENC